jgi:hypothetical protein
LKLGKLTPEAAPKGWLSYLEDIMEQIKKIWEKIKDFVKKALSPILDREWHLDGYKIGGFACYIASYWLTNEVFGMAAGSSDTKVAVLGGLAAGFITAGTYLFNQARKSDDTLPK